jgi:simple sugar transport system ATP-binding protein
VDLDLDAEVASLPTAGKQLVAIARALMSDARLIIMDEPTTALTRKEVETLFRIVRDIQARGIAILFVSHKMREMLEISERITVIRNGRKVAEGPTGDFDEALITRHMTGGDILNQPYAWTPPPGPPPVPRLEIRGLTVPGKCEELSLAIRPGEIVGLSGLLGSGRTDLALALFGMVPRYEGEILIDGAPVRLRTTQEAIAAGIAYVPEDRQSQGAVLPFGVRENTTLASLMRHARLGFLSLRSEIADTRRFGTRLAVKAASWDQKLQELSGGNQQKVVIAKWLATNPKVIVLDEPTKGIDVGSKAAVHDFMVDLAAEGLAVVLISSELPEVMGMSDRILVMHEGRIVKEFARAEMDAAAIVTAATGGQT